MGSLKRLGGYIKKDKRARASAFSTQQSDECQGGGRSGCASRGGPAPAARKRRSLGHQLLTGLLYSISLQLRYFPVPTPGQMVSKVLFLSDTLGLYSAPSILCFKERRESTGSLERQRGSHELVERDGKMRSWVTSRLTQVPGPLE